MGEMIGRMKENFLHGIGKFLPFGVLIFDLLGQIKGLNDAQGILVICLVNGLKTLRRMRLVHAKRLGIQYAGIPDLMGIQGMRKQGKHPLRQMIPLFQQQGGQFLVEVVVVGEEVCKKFFHDSLENQFNRILLQILRSQVG